MNYWAIAVAVGAASSWVAQWRENHSAVVSKGYNSNEFSKEMSSCECVAIISVWHAEKANGPGVTGMMGSLLNGIDGTETDSIEMDATGNNSVAVAEMKKDEERRAKLLS